MKIERKLVITWKWNPSDYPSLTKDQLELLDEHAESRAIEVYRQEGYLSGELIYEDGEISVSGWWNICKETLTEPN